MLQDENSPFLSHVEPVLAVTDVVKTVHYWHEELGFPNKWTWGDPPNHGGVTWQGVFIQFSQNPKLASASKGNSIFIRVRNIEAFYHFHQEKKVDIVEPLENKPWGLAAYTLRDLNGYYLTFAGALVSDRERSSEASNFVKIIARNPTAEEYVKLLSAVGWDKNHNHSKTSQILSAPVFSVVAEDEHEQVVGCVLVLSDNASFYYVKDMMVHPDWQNKHVGSKLMKTVTEWLDANAPENAYVGLFTAENLASFYKQFDFAPAYGMSRRIIKK